MKAMCSSVTSVAFQLTSRRYIPSISLFFFIETTQSNIPWQAGLSTEQLEISPPAGDVKLEDTLVHMTLNQFVKTE
jgi:hypothetical protein